MTHWVVVIVTDVREQNDEGLLYRLNSVNSGELIRGKRQSYSILYTGAFGASLRVSDEQ